MSAAGPERRAVSDIKAGPVYSSERRLVGCASYALPGLMRMKLLHWAQDPVGARSH